MTIQDAERTVDELKALLVDTRRERDRLDDISRDAARAVYSMGEKESRITYALKSLEDYLSNMKQLEAMDTPSV